MPALPTALARWSFAVVSLVVFATGTLADEAVQAPSVSEPAAQSQTGSLNADMKLDDLVKQDVMVPALSQVVNTVDRTESTVGRSSAAVFVITQEMIKRSGARSIPEALRMAPGLEVARLDAHTWAISARGFNNKFSNKLLVQIDRRIVYTPTFGGVYWDTVDYPLDDIDRIEVIRGPQVVAWGSNAVNGVINIITKRSQDTQGALVVAGGGMFEQRDFTTVRYGGQTAEDLTWRAYGQQFNRDNGWSRTGIQDNWDQQRGGFRMDYTPTQCDTITVQGDIYNGYEGERNGATIPVAPFTTTVNREVHAQGGDVLFRWSKQIDDDTGWQFQSYYDHYDRNRTGGLSDSRSIYDLDFQYNFSPWEYHQIICGAHYRNSPDVEDPILNFSLVPNEFTTQWASVYGIDKLALVEDRWYLELGCRLEQHTFGNFQAEPMARLLFLPSDRASAWMAVSRAVRNPTRFDADIRVTSRVVGTFIQVQGDPNFKPEDVMSYEVGYRAAPTDNFSWDVAGYISEYRNLLELSGLLGPIANPPFVPTQLIHHINGDNALTYGVELSGNWKWTDNWSWRAYYTMFQIDAQGDGTFFANIYNGSTPHNQAYLQSSMNLSKNVTWDVIGRYVDKLRRPNVPHYFEVDTRIGWQIRKNLEFAFVGQNLINNHHLEFTDTQLGLQSTQVRRSFYGMLTWTY